MDAVGPGAISFEGLCAAVGPIAERYGVSRVTLFGSMARGDSRDGSDYDFCVSLGRIDGLIKLCGFILDLESSLGAPVDVVSDRMLDEDMKREVFNDGKLVYQA
jgi:predicted nucleotidyltransferase